MTIINDTRVVRLQRTAARTGHQHSADERIVETVTDELVTASDVVSLPPGSLITLQRGPGSGHTEEGSILNSAGDDIGGVAGGQTTSVSFDSEDAGATAASIFQTEVDFAGTLSASGEYAVNYKTFQVKTYDPVPTTAGSRILVSYTWAPIREYLEWDPEDLFPDLVAFGVGPHQAGGGTGGDGYDVYVTVSDDDVLNGTLIDKLTAGHGISLSIDNAGGDETLRISSDIRLDGYAFDSTVTEHYNQFGDIVQTILGELDGYHPDQTGTEHYHQHSEAIETILAALDGYGGGGPGDGDELVKISSNDSAAGYLLSKLSAGYGISLSVDDAGAYESLRISSDIRLDGYAFDSTVTEHYHQHSEAIQIILNELDGYASDQTVSEHYTQVSNTIQVILTELDGYHPDITGIEHYHQHSEAIETILKELDGYATSGGTDIYIKVSADDTTTNYLSEKVAAGYGISLSIDNAGGNEQLRISSDLRLDGYAFDSTVSEHYKQHSDAILAILNELDGYASDQTVSEHYNQHSTAIQIILNDLDGYAADQTVWEHYHQHSIAIQTILSELDGYHPDITGTEHYHQHSEAISAILKELDGYAGGADIYVKVSADDTTSGYLSDKVIAGYGVSLSIDDAGGDETLRISSDIRLDGYAFDSTVTEHYKQHSDAIQIILSELDGYHPDVTGTEHYHQHSEAILAILAELDGYAADQTVIEHYHQHSQAIQIILNDLDGYASDQTVSEHYIQHSNALQSILKELDGYLTTDADVMVKVSGDDTTTGYLTDKIVAGYGISFSIDDAGGDEALRVSSDIRLDGYAFDSTVTEHYKQHSDTIQIILGELDGYHPDITGTEHYNQHNAILQNILAALDGYAADQTVIEHYLQHSDTFQTIIKDLDGYASDQTVSEHYTQHSDAIQTILSELDGYLTTDADVMVKVSGDDTTTGYLTDKVIAGYGVSLSIDDAGGDEQLRISSDLRLDGYAFDSTVSEHYNQHSEAILTILAELDGYHPDQTGTEHYHQHSEAIRNILVELDGYAADSTVSEHYNQHSETIQTIIKDLDGYAADSTVSEHYRQLSEALQTILNQLDGYASDQTVSEHYSQHSTAIQIILSDLDGYASDVTVSEHYHQHSEAIRTILAELDGYHPDQTGTEHYNQHSEILQNILAILDGYAADQTVIEHYIQHSDTFQTILKDLDGYASDQTVSEHYTQHSDTLQTILKELDGYLTTDADVMVKVSGDDTTTGYLTDKIVAGYGVSLSIDDAGADEALRISSDIRLDGYAFDSTVSEHYRQHSEAILTILAELDGYHPDQTGTEHYHQHSETIKTILKDLDGYASDQTISEHYRQLSNTLQTILNDLDGYAADSTVSEHYNQYSTTIQTILKDLDGYAADSTVSEHYKQHSQAIGHILQALDGYDGNVFHVRKLGTEADDFPFSSVFSLDGYVYPTGESRLIVHINGITQSPPFDYVERSTGSIEFVEPVDHDDVIDIWILPGSLGGGFGGTTDLQNAYDNSTGGSKTISVSDGQIVFTQTQATGSALKLNSTSSLTPTLVIDQDGTGEALRLKSVSGSSSSLLIQKDTTARNTIVNTTITERTTSHILGGQTGIGSASLTRLESSGTVLFDASKIVTGTTSVTDSVESAYLAIELSEEGVLEEKARFTSDGSLGINTDDPYATLHVQGDGYVAAGLEVAGQVKVHNSPNAPINIPVLTDDPPILKHGDVWASEIGGTRKINIYINGATYSVEIT